VENVARIVREDRRLSISRVFFWFDDSGQWELSLFLIIQRQKMKTSNEDKAQDGVEI
jgi:hypothetical protein